MSRTTPAVEAAPESRWQNRNGSPARPSAVGSEAVEDPDSGARESAGTFPGRMAVAMT